MKDKVNDLALPGIADEGGPDLFVLGRLSFATDVPFCPTRPLLTQVGAKT